MKISMKLYIAMAGSLLFSACQKTSGPSSDESAPSAVNHEPATATPSSAPVKPAVGSRKTLAVGDTIPAKDVEMKNVDGQMTSIAKVAKSKGTLVVFTCNHCPYAKGWEQRITALGNEFLLKDVGVIAINSNDPVKVPEDDFSSMQERSKKLGMEFPYVVDATSEMARIYGATKTPEIFLFDGEAKLVYRGAVDDNFRDPSKVESHYLREALEALVSGQTIKQAETKAIGCSIKLRAQS